jgi:phosphoglycerol transferase MdoB-like AlkP superfamily enzyme
MRDRITLFIRIIGFWLLLFIANRLIFTFINASDENTLTLIEYFIAQWHGLRLDISMTSYVLAISAILLTLPYQMPVRILHYIAIPLMVIIMVIDTILFSFWGTHFDSGALIFMERINTISMSLTTWQIVIYLFWMVTGTVLTLIAFRYLAPQKKLSSPYKWYYLPTWLFLSALMIIPIRGGLQHAPINTGVAYHSTNNFANQVAINPVWNFAYSMKRYNKLSRSFHYLPDTVSAAIFEKTTALHENSTGVLKNSRPSIIVVMLESFSGNIIGIRQQDKEVTPFYNKLTSESILFDSLYATNTRSDKGIVGVLSGYPVLPGISILKYPQKSSSLPKLSNTLRPYGYSDMTFIYGGDIGFANMISYIQMGNYNQIVSKKDFAEDLCNKKWGVHDEHTFEYLLSDVDKSRSPFFKVLFTLSSHEPFDVPMKREFDDDYLNSVHYTDRCIGEFIGKAKEKPWWDSTLIVFISDHGTGWPAIQNTNLDRFRITMLWTGGALLKRDTVIKTIGSQADFAATLLTQLEIPANDYRFSKNMLSVPAAEGAFVVHNEGFGYKNSRIEQWFDITYNNYYFNRGAATTTDSLISKAWIQELYNDYIAR